MEGSVLLIIVAALTALVYFLQALDLLEERIKRIKNWIKKHRHKKVGAHTNEVLSLPSDEHSIEDEQEIPPQHM